MQLSDNKKRGPQRLNNQDNAVQRAGPAVITKSDELLQHDRHIHWETHHATHATIGTHLQSTLLDAHHATRAVIGKTPK